MHLIGTTTCPQCASENVRVSRWGSHAEKSAHPGRLPYRCVDCSCRFLAERGADSSKGMLLLGIAAAAVLIGVIAIGLMFWLSDPSDMHDADIEIAETTSAPPEAAINISAIRQAAQEGDVEAQYRLGKSLLLDAAFDHAKASEALEWLSQAARNNHTGAMIQLGQMYRTGIGALQNYAEAMRWIQLAAEMGDNVGMLELGRLYRDGVGVDRDPVTAYVWLNRSAALHNHEAARERDTIGRRLKPEQLLKAQQLSTEAERDRAVKKAAGQNNSPVVPN